MNRHMSVKAHVSSKLVTASITLLLALSGLHANSGPEWNPDLGCAVYYIDTTTTLQQDYSNTLIYIIGSDITLNMNNRIIWGPTNLPGILVDNQEDVTILNGMIFLANTGIAVYGGKNVDINSVYVADCGFGIEIDADSCTLNNCLATDCRNDGFVVQDGSNMTRIYSSTANFSERHGILDMGERTEIASASKAFGCDADGIIGFECYKPAYNSCSATYNGNDGISYYDNYKYTGNQTNLSVLDNDGVGLRVQCPYTMYFVSTKGLRNGATDVWDPLYGTTHKYRYCTFDRIN